MNSFFQTKQVMETNDTDPLSVTLNISVALGESSSSKKY
jgi:hypothetical protein